MTNEIQHNRWDHPGLSMTRRELLCRSGMGMGALALTGVMGEVFGDETNSTGSIDSPLAPKQPHFAAKAKRVIHLFLNGGPSHVDTFDHKPALDKYHGQELPKSMHLVTERAHRHCHEVALQVPALRSERN